MINAERYANTPKHGKPFSVEETQPFEEALPEVQDVPSLTTVHTTGEIIGITFINKYKMCYKCNTKVILTAKTAECKKCRMTLKERKCPTQWYMRVLFEEDISSKSLQQAAYMEVISTFADLCEISNLSEITQIS